MAGEKPGKNFSYFIYCFFRFLVKTVYHKMTVEGAENLPDEPCILVGNHTQMNGPICGQFYMPVKVKIWCAWQMMYLKEVPAYAYKDFWSNKPRYIRWFFKLFSYMIAPLSVCIFNNASTIPVFRDSRIITTFKQTVSSLNEGESIVIFPECYDPHNHIVNDFQDKFIDLARLYFKRTGKAVKFVPMYIAPALKKICFGKPIEYSPESNPEDERRKIAVYLMDEITDIAVNLPLHKVVPYANIPSKEYKFNKER